MAKGTTKVGKTVSMEINAENRAVLDVPLKDIVSNSRQSRGNGVLPVLGELGYGLFEKKDVEKEPLWPSLTGDDEARRKEAAELVAAHEPDVVELARDIATNTQLQAGGVTRDRDGKYDVLFGMRRALALAYLQVYDPLGKDPLTPATPGKYPAALRAEIFPADLDEVKLRFIAYSENNTRKGESPMDRAKFYAEMKREHKLTPNAIAERIDKSGQHVKDYLSLLDPLLKDKWTQLAAGEMGVDPALKLLKRRREGSGDETRDADPKGRERRRFPPLKTIERIYDGVRPKDFDDKRWALWTSEPVRELLVSEFGFKKKPFKEKAAPAAESNGKAAANGTGSVKITVRRATADKLLVCLGKTNAATWPDEKVVAALNNVTSIAEEGQQVEDKNAQKLLDVLISKFSQGLNVVLQKDEKK